MNRDYVVSLLIQNNIQIKEEKRMTNNLGTLIRTVEGCIVNVYDSGKVNCQGKNKEVVEGLFKSTTVITDTWKVFVVYGHDMNARTQLEAMLRRWDIEPLIIDQLVSSGNTIIEKLEENTDKVNFGIVLATPDDIGYAKDSEDKKIKRSIECVKMLSLKWVCCLLKLEEPKWLFFCHKWKKWKNRLILMD